MRTFLNNFWVCLAVCLFLSFSAVTSYTEEATGWAWMLGIAALLWLNDARRALNREKEAANEQDGTPEG